MVVYSQKNDIIPSDLDNLIVSIKSTNPILVDWTDDRFSAKTFAQRSKKDALEFQVRTLRDITIKHLYAAINNHVSITYPLYATPEAIAIIEKELEEKGFHYYTEYPNIHIFVPSPKE